MQLWISDALIAVNTCLLIFNMLLLLLLVSYVEKEQKEKKGGKEREKNWFERNRYTNRNN